MFSIILYNEVCLANAHVVKETKINNEIKIESLRHGAVLSQQLYVKKKKTGHVLTTCFGNVHHDEMVMILTIIDIDLVSINVEAVRLKY